MAAIRAAELDALDVLTADILRHLRPLIGQAFTEDTVAEITPRLMGHFSAEDIDEKHVRSTLMQYLRTTVTKPWARMLARQMAARQEELVSGPLMVFDRVVVPEWIPVEIVGVDAAVWREDAPGTKLGVLALMGRAAGHTLHRKVPTNWLSWLAYQIGFSRRRTYEHDPIQLIGLRTVVHVVPGSGPDGPGFDDWNTPSTLLKYNQDVIKKRMRFDVEPNRTGDDVCFFQFEHECSACEKPSHICNASFIRNAL